MAKKTRKVKSKWKDEAFEKNGSVREKRRAKKEPIITINGVQVYKYSLTVVPEYAKKTEKKDKKLKNIVPISSANKTAAHNTSNLPASKIAEINIQQMENIIQHLINTKSFTVQCNFCKSIFRNTPKTIVAHILNHWPNLKVHEVASKFLHCFTEKSQSRIVVPTSISKENPKNIIKPLPEEAPTQPIDLRATTERLKEEINKFIAINHKRYTPQDLVAQIAMRMVRYMEVSQKSNDDLFVAINPMVANKLGFNHRLLLHQELKRLSQKYLFPINADLASLVELEKKSPFGERLVNMTEGKIVEIPWSEVKFYNGWISLNHPDHIHEGVIKPFVYQDARVKKVFSLVNELFMKRLPPIKVETQNGRIVKILEIPNFLDCIGVLDQASLPPDFSFMDGKTRGNVHALSKEVLRQLISSKDEKYLRYLCKMHLERYKAFHILEQRVNSNLIPSDESGWIFVLRDQGNIVSLVYENDNPARATLVFRTKNASINRAITWIYQFFSSDIVNKREKLQDHTINATNSGIIDYFHIYHTTFHEWKHYLQVYV